MPAWQRLSRPLRYLRGQTISIEFLCKTTRLDAEGYPHARARVVFGPSLLDERVRTAWRLALVLPVGLCQVAGEARAEVSVQATKQVPASTRHPRQRGRAFKGKPPAGSVRPVGATSYGTPLPAPPRPETPRGEVLDSEAIRTGAVPFTPPLLLQLPASPPLTSGGTLFLNTKGITFRPADEDLKFRIGGRLQQDFSVADIRPGCLGPAVDDNTGTRRAFLEGYVTTTYFTAAIQYDFNNMGAPINDGVVSYHGFGPFVLTVGNFIEPFSLNALESNDTTTFTERSLMNALAPQDAFGASDGASGDRWTATVGVFGANVVPGPSTNGVAGTGRVTYAPILDKGQVLQLGIAGSYRALSASNPAPSFSSTPEDSLFASTLVTTGALDHAANIIRAGGEALYQVGSVRVQAEYDHVDVTGRDGQTARAFQGGYVEAAWVVNGDGRPSASRPPTAGISPCCKV